jgi:NADH:ubiquinone oxidoreductase subunit F (NADH-binding)
MNPVFWEQPKEDQTPQARALSMEDREHVIQKLAEILVNDYQKHQQNKEQNQAVTEDTVVGTVKSPGLYNRGGGAFVQTPDPYAGRQSARSMEQLIST